MNKYKIETIIVNCTFTIVNKDGNSINDIIYDSYQNAINSKEEYRITHPKLFTKIINHLNIPEFLKAEDIKLINLII